ncbi:unnamed protein product [Adineta ricciae]|uniref:Uncharacterized protein n=1 Tax=Adineta ricciae TaxID=249248 RepID=A0A814E8K9_ADIRI|nr:unnamed protein product [Adineta ricciae]
MTSSFLTSYDETSHAILFLIISYQLLFIFRSENTYGWSNQLHIVNNSDYNGALIPCEYCQQGIEWDDYDRHIKLCQEDAHRKLVQKSQHGHWSPVTAISHSIQKIKCMFCSTSMSSNGISSHQMHCTKNPHRNNN